MSKSEMLKIKMVKPEWSIKQTNTSEILNVKSSELPKDPKPKRPSPKVLKTPHFSFWGFWILDISDFDSSDFDILDFRPSGFLTFWIFDISNFNILHFRQSVFRNSIFRHSASEPKNPALVTSDRHECLLFPWNPITPCTVHWNWEEKIWNAIYLLISLQSKVKPIDDNSVLNRNNAKK